jgi:hypothetical protein
LHDSHPSFDELQGQKLLLTVDNGAQEAFDNPSEFGLGGHPVGQVGYPGASNHNDGFFNEKDSVSGVSFRDFNDMNQS